jgi:Protein of unknown function (DUF998)
MSAQQQTGLSETGRSERRKAITTLGAVAGLIGPLIFTVGFVIQGLLRPGEYDPIAEPVSALEAGPNGWIQQLNFIVFGLLMLISITAAVLMPLFFAMAFLVVPESAPLHPWWGLGQRVVLAVWFPCLMVLAVRLWQVARLEWPALDQAETGEDRWTRVSLS